MFNWLSGGGGEQVTRCSNKGGFGSFRSFWFKLAYVSSLFSKSLTMTCLLLVRHGARWHVVYGISTTCVEFLHRARWGSQEVHHPGGIDYAGATILFPHSSCHSPAGMYRLPSGLP